MAARSTFPEARMTRTCAATLALTALAVSLPAHQGAPPAADPLLARALAIHQRVPLIDGHNDYPWALRERVPSLDLARLDIRGPQPAVMTDVPRLRAGGVGAQFWSVYVPSSTQGQGAVRMTLEQIDVVDRMARRYPDTFEMARTAADVERIHRAGRIASLIGVEGGHSIDGSLATLRAFSALGAGYMTLTHSANVPWADAATDSPVLGGLSAFGELVVGEMNRLGMLVDLSHVSPDTMKDALRVSQAPVIFSHSSARAIADVPRNVPDEVLRLLPANGGVVMVTFVPSFVSPEGGPAFNATFAELKRLQQVHPDDAAAQKRGMDAFLKAHPGPKATLAMVADHIDHIRAVAGIDHIGIGSDFDGIESVPEGLEDVSKYPALSVELLRRGYSDADVGKIIGGNVLRVMRQAEAVAARLQKERPPASARMEDVDRK
jgi:membrane dipeptidase